jgi:SAM-dependent methyltransferase
MPGSATAQRVRSRFTAKARPFDDLYEDERLDVRLLRPGLLWRRQLAIDTVAAHPGARVLDVGCGSGRIAELILGLEVSRYLGIDFSEPMIELSRERLARFRDPAPELVLGDFLRAEIGGEFDVILALGFFDYIEDPAAFIARMCACCAPGGSVVASFPAFSAVKGPIRKVRYEWIGNCPIFNYTRPQLQRLFRECGFGSVEIRTPGRSGFLLRARRDPQARGAGEELAPGAGTGARSSPPESSLES